MIEYEEDFICLLIFKLNGSLIPRACWLAIPAVCVTLSILFYKDYDPVLFEDLGLENIHGSQLWNAVTATLTMLLGFRTKQGLMRFWQGTGLLHMMRGEWFDTVSNCVTFSISAKKVKEHEVNIFRHSLVRLMSRCHGSALEEIANDSFQLEAIDTFGLDNGTLAHLRLCHEVYNFNKVEVMLHLVQSLITKAHDDGILKIPPPILSRVYQTISRGFVNLLNAKKICDTSFPFPYVQLISFLLIVHMFLTPLMIATAIENKVLASLMTFVPIMGMSTLSFIAAELENPFGTDDNDLPMAHFQEEMNKCLLMLLHPNTDMITTVSPDCCLEFEDLLVQMDGQREAGKVCRLSTIEIQRAESDLSAQEESAMESQTTKGGSKRSSDVKPESIADHRPPAPSEEASAPPPPPPTTKELVSKGIDEFENGFKQWMKSVGTQVTQLNESFNALKTFNETTSKIIQETSWPKPPNSPQTEGTGWQTAISPI